MWTWYRAINVKADGKYTDSYNLKVSLRLHDVCGWLRKAGCRFNSLDKLEISVEWRENRAVLRLSSSFVPVQQDALLSRSVTVVHHVFTFLSSCKLLVVTDFAKKGSPEVGLVVL